MPVQPCSTTIDGETRQGRRWGDTGTCYPCGPDGDCAEAEAQAQAQGAAIEAQNSLRSAEFARRRLSEWR